jgi:hypothetical protein
MRGGNRDDRQRAQRLSDFVDSLVVQSRIGDSTPSGHTDRELDHLAQLAADLTAIGLTPEPGVRERLFRQVTQVPVAPGRASRPFGSAFGRIVRSGLRLAAVFAVGVAAAFGVLDLLGSRNASASAILTKSDLAIARLVRPGKVLFRRWRIVERMRDRSDGPERVVERFTLEWIDGSDIRHATGKSQTPSGRVYLAYANGLDHGRYVPRVYYEPGFADEANGLVSIVPSRQEFEAAASRFSGSERQVVDRYLARGYIYEPIVSERRFNDAMLQPVVGREPLPQVVLSVDDSAALDGVPVYRVRSIEAIRVPFRWASSGPPKAWLERQETIRYIAKDSYLTLRAEETVEGENGRVVHTIRELVETKTLDVRDGENPFALQIPPDVPTRRQSAFEHLSQITRTLRRAPAFLAQH